MSIQLQNLTKRFGTFTALDGVNLQVRSRELLALLGPSGSGKTTLLRAIAGLECPDSGTIWLDGKSAEEKKTRDRNVGFVFQHYALFRHRTVYENIAFGLEVKPRRSRPKAAQIREKVFELLRLIQLDWAADRLPAQLSGGQRQRVALARALVLEPKYLLLDEPFGALDAQVRKELRRWLRSLHEQIGITTVFVTHDQEEALELADRVVIFNKGRIEQVGTPDEVYERPANPFVTQFLGTVNLFHGRIQRGFAELDFGRIAVPEHAAVDSAEALVYARPHEIELRRRFFGEPAILAQVRQLRHVGSTVKVALSLEDERHWLEVELSREEYEALRPQGGEWVLAQPKRLRVFLQDAEQPRLSA